MLFVAYGFKLYTHTHSYIHYGFIRGFQALGWDTMWIDDNDNKDSKIFPPGTLFLCSGGEAITNIPLRDDCYYIFHNHFPDQLKNMPQNHILSLQVDTRSTSRTGIKLSEASLYDPEENMLYTVWATDLLPEEIDIENALINYENKQKAVIFIGSLNNCPIFGNMQQVMPYVEEANRDGYQWRQFTSPFSHPVDNETQRKLISECILAPSIVGHWQQKQGYIPCRIFKTISYGCIGITNSKYVNELLHNNCIYHQDSRELYRLSAEFFQQSIDIIKNKLKIQMELVKDHHTYINRVKDIIRIFQEIKNNSSFTS